MNINLRINTLSSIFRQLGCPLKFWVKTHGKPEVAQSGIGLLNNYDFIHIDPIKAVQPVVYLLSSVFSPLGVIKNSGVYVKTNTK